MGQHGQNTFYLQTGSSDVKWLIDGIGYGVLAVSLAGLAACSQPAMHTLVTIADATDSPAQVIDTGEPGDSPGDILVFDQPLLDTERQTIGNNSGSCIRTRSGHSLQCQWTLTLAEGTIQVAGREFDRGTSAISITGGTGSYAGISGEMLSVNNGDGTFTQTLHYRLGVK
jgi:hypothetical protein